MIKLILFTYVVVFHFNAGAEIRILPRGFHDNSSVREIKTGDKWVGIDRTGLVREITIKKLEMKEMNGDSKGHCEISFEPDGYLEFAIKGLPLKVGQTLISNPPKPSILFPGQTHESDGALLMASGAVEAPKGNKHEIFPKFARYEIGVKIRGKYSRLAAVASEPASVIWFGDLNGDKVNDVILDVEMMGKGGSALKLFLSQKSGDHLIMKEAASGMSLGL